MIRKFGPSLQTSGFHSNVEAQIQERLNNIFSGGTYLLFALRASLVFYQDSVKFTLVCRPSYNKGLSVFFRDMFCAGRVVEEDLKRTMKACGGSIQTSVNNMTDDVLGRCELFEEEQIGGERYMHAIPY